MSEEREVFVPVVGFEGLYVVSNLGSVKSLDRTTSDGRSIKGKLLSSGRRNGYPTVRFYVDGERSCHCRHVLVAAAFLGERPPNQECRHKDGNRANPRLQNLEYGTRRQNIEDSRRHGTMAIGERGGKAKLTKEQVNHILSSTLGNAVLARQLGVTDSTVCTIRKAKSWKHVERTEVVKSRNLNGESNPSVKLTEQQVLYVLGSALSGAALARELGVSTGLIGHIRSGRAWKHLPRPAKSAIEDAYMVPHKSEAV